MSEMNRRTAIAAMMATATAGLAPGAEASEPWPYPHIGRDAIPPDWRPGGPWKIRANNSVIIGIFVGNGRVLSRGRIYTHAEFQPIKAAMPRTGVSYSCLVSVDEIKKASSTSTEGLKAT